jgi:hypothetical protein
MVELRKESRQGARVGSHFGDHLTRFRWNHSRRLEGLPPGYTSPMVPTAPWRVNVGIPLDPSLPYRPRIPRITMWVNIQTPCATRAPHRSHVSQREMYPGRGVATPSLEGMWCMGRAFPGASSRGRFPRRGAGRQGKGGRRMEPPFPETDASASYRRNTPLYPVFHRNPGGYKQGEKQELKRGRGHITGAQFLPESTCPKKPRPWDFSRNT